MANTDNYRTNDVCRMFDISKPTLFKWEKEGKISQPERDWRGWRIYTERHIAEIRDIIHGQSKLPFQDAL
ncbi:MerR family transcriptional regulator [bacterium]|nr:MerR family transcriptional regulator [bacterium]